MFFCLLNLPLLVIHFNQLFLLASLFITCAVAPKQETWSEPQFNSAFFPQGMINKSIISIIVLPRHWPFFLPCVLQHKKHGIESMYHFLIPYILVKISTPKHQAKVTVEQPCCTPKGLIKNFKYCAYIHFVNCFLCKQFIKANLRLLCLTAEY